MTDQIRAGALAADDFKAGAVQVDKIYAGADLVFDNLAAIFGPPDFVSSEFTPAAAALFQAAHSLGGEPDIIVVELICKVANNGYSIGDRIAWNGITVDIAAAIDESGTIIGFDSTNCFVTVGANRWDVAHKTTGARVDVTNANWAFVFKAWSLPADFTSSDLGDLVGSTKYAAAHGLGSAPKFMAVELKCLIAEDGYSVGDIIQHRFTTLYNSGNGVNTGRGECLGYNATDLFSLIATSNLVDKSTGQNSGVPTPSNWSYKLKAWDLPTPDFISSTITPIPEGAAFSAAHGLTSVDFMMANFIVNTASEANSWDLGDVMPFQTYGIDMAGGTSNRVDGACSGIDSANIFAVTGSDAVRVLDKATPLESGFGNITSAVATNWKIQFLAWGT